MCLLLQQYSTAVLLCSARICVCSDTAECVRCVPAGSMASSSISNSDSALSAAQRWSYRAKDHNNRTMSASILHSPLPSRAAPTPPLTDGISSNRRLSPAVFGHLPQLQSPGLPPYEFNIQKVRAPRIHPRTSIPSHGIFNGTRYGMCPPPGPTSSRLFKGQGRIGAATWAPKQAVVPRAMLDSNERTTFPFAPERRQLSVTRAFATTINKEQGLNI